MYKKFLCLLLLLIIPFAFCGCGQDYDCYNKLYVGYEETCGEDVYSVLNHENVIINKKNGKAYFKYKCEDGTIRELPQVKAESQKRSIKLAGTSTEKEYEIVRLDFRLEYRGGNLYEGFLKKVASTEQYYIPSLDVILADLSHGCYLVPNIDKIVKD